MVLNDATKEKMIKIAAAIMVALVITTPFFVTKGKPSQLLVIIQPVIRVYANNTSIQFLVIGMSAIVYRHIYMKIKGTGANDTWKNNTRNNTTYNIFSTDLPNFYINVTCITNQAGRLFIYVIQYFFNISSRYPVYIYIYQPSILGGTIKMTTNVIDLALIETSTYP